MKHLATRLSVREAIDVLASDPLRHVVLLKQLLAYPEHVKVHQVGDGRRTATMVTLDVSASPYDRATYPNAAVAAFIVSDHPELVAALLPHLPTGAGIVFKLASEADLAPVAARFPVVRRTAFVSFTSDRASEADRDIGVTTMPDAAAFDLFAMQGHDRNWLEPLLGAGKAFACVLERAAIRFPPALHSRTSAGYGRWAAWSPRSVSAAKAWARVSCARRSPSSIVAAWWRAIKSRRTIYPRSAWRSRLASHGS
jgi:hypothetical protein